MKTQKEQLHTEPGRGDTINGATDMASDPTLDQKAVAFLAYSYWEARGCPYDSPDEDWFRAEAELRNRLAAVATA